MATQPVSGRAPLGRRAARATAGGLRLRRGVAFLAVCGLAAGAPRGTAAQTPFTATGLGYPVPPVDARAAALGTTGVGLLGSTFSLRNPAEIAYHPLSGVIVTLAPEAVEVEGPRRSNDTGRSRFSVIRAVVKMDDWAMAIGFGSELDQDYEVRFEDTLAVTAGTFPFEEVREHDGGVSTIDFSLARRLGPLSLGVGVQRLTGSLRQSFIRRFQPDVEGQGLAPRPIQMESRVSYGAWRVRGGAAVNLGDRVMVGGAVSRTTELRSRADTTGAASNVTVPEDRAFPMPASVEVGASVLVVRDVLLTGAGGWSGWSRLDGAIEGTAARDVRWGGAGVEFGGLEVIGMFVPLRVGGRWARLPFFPEDREQPTERALSLGFGAIFRGGLAEVNLAGEVGRRGDLAESGIEESFRRLTVSFVLRQ